MPRKRRGRRRRNARTQKPVSVTVHRTGTGRATELTTYTWASAPTAWDAAAAGMAAQVRKAQGVQKKAARRRFIARAERRKEVKAEKWRRRFQTPSDSPFMRLPGMAGQSIIHRRQPVVSAEARQQSGIASRGSATTLTPELASTILTLRAQGLSYRRIAAEVQHPESTIRHWIGSGRAKAVSTDRGRANYC